MADSQGDAIYRVLLKTDEKAKEEAVKALEKVTKRQELFAIGAEKGIITYEKAAKEIRHLAIEQRRLEGVIASTEDSWRGATLALENYEEKIQSLSRAGGLAGDTAGTIGFTAGLANTLGATSVGTGLDLGSQFFDLQEQLPKMKAQFETLGEALRTTQGRMGKYIKSTGDLASAIPGVSASMGSFFAVIGPTAIAVGLAAVAIAQYKKGMEEQRKVLEATINAMSDVRQAISEGLTTEDAQARLEELRRSRDNEAETLGILQGSYDQMLNELDESFGILSGPITAGIQLFDSREQELFESIQSSNSSIAAMDAEIRALERSLEDGTLAANDIAEAETTLAEEREAEIEELSQQVEQARERTTALLEQEAEMHKDRADAARDAAETQALEDEFAREDQLEQEREFRDELANIAENGRARVEALQAELGTAATEALTEIQEIENKGRLELKELESDYYKQRQKEFEDFATETKRIDEDTNRERLRLVEDINKRLRGAAQNNDVIAFLEAQEEGAVELKRGAEDANVAEKRRVEDFVKAQREAAQEFREQHQETLTQIAEEKAAAKKAAEERRSDLLEQIESEKLATEQELQNERKRFEESEAREAQQAERQRRRDELAEMQEERAFQERLTEIRTEQAAWQQTFSIISSNLANLQSQSYSSSSGTKTKSAFNNSVSSNGRPSGGAFGQITGSSNKLSSYGRNKSPVNYSPTFNTSVGDIASRAEVSKALNDFASANAQELNSFIKGAINLR